MAGPSRGTGLVGLGGPRRPRRGRLRRLRSPPPDAHAFAAVCAEAAEADRRFAARAPIRRLGGASWGARRNLGPSEGLNSTVTLCGELFSYIGHMNRSIRTFHHQKIATALLRPPNHASASASSAASTPDSTRRCPYGCHSCGARSSRRPLAAERVVVEAALVALLAAVFGWRLQVGGVLAIASHLQLLGEVVYVLPLNSPKGKGEPQR